MVSFLENSGPVSHIFDVFIRSQTADMGPPLGTVLGNLGVNSSKFCKDFNEFTKELPDHFLLKVRILVFENRSYSFFVFAPSSSFVLNSLKFQRNLILSKDRQVKLKSFFCIDLGSLLKAVKFYFPEFDIKQGLSII
jgi:Ribosomal protein L11